MPEAANGERKIVATFTIFCDDQGNTKTNMDGPFPSGPLLMGLVLAQHKLMSQVAAMEARTAALQRSRVLLPDGSAPTF